MQHWQAVLQSKTRSGESKYKLLVQAITLDIENSVLSDGEKLPPQRQVAEALGISLQTVSNAYKELERDGLIKCEVGRGSYVSHSVTEKFSSYMLDSNENSVADFSIARLIHTPEHDRLWRETCLDLSKEDDQPWVSDCRPVAGLEHHRATGISWVENFGVQANYDTLVITNGASHGIFLALSALASTNDTVLCAKLNDHSVIGAANVLGFNLKGVDFDDYGIKPDHFEDICANEPVSAIVCIPNMHNPTGAIMPINRRMAIAKIARKYGVYIIEDDVYGPLLKQPYLSISHYAPELSFYCSSFTKSVMTGLRTGYLAVPNKFILRINSLLRVCSWMATPLLAEVASRWIENGNAQYLIDLQRTELSKRHAIVDKTLGSYIKNKNEFGLSAWINVPDWWHIDVLGDVLRRRGIAVTLPEPFAVRKPYKTNAFRLCVGADMNHHEFHRALVEIKNTIEQQPSDGYFI